MLQQCCMFCMKCMVLLLCVQLQWVLVYYCFCVRCGSIFFMFSYLFGLRFFFLVILCVFFRCVLLMLQVVRVNQLWFGFLMFLGSLLWICMKYLLLFWMFCFGLSWLDMFIVWVVWLVSIIRLCMLVLEVVLGCYSDFWQLMVVSRCQLVFNCLLFCLKWFLQCGRCCCRCWVKVQVLMQLSMLICLQ